MTSLKRKHADALEAVDEAHSSPNSTTFLYDPAAPAFQFKFLDDMVLKYCKRMPDEQGCPDSSELICCPRAYEESFLREPVQDERQCLRAENCEGLKIPCKDPFVLREFVYPNSAPCAASQQRSLCLMCIRYETARLHFHAESSQDMARNVFISKHYNVVGVPGEYSVQDCIVSGGKYTGLPLPVVLHVRSAYELAYKGGVKHYVQDHMKTPSNDDDSTQCSFLTRGAALKRQGAAHTSS